MARTARVCDCMGDGRDGNTECPPVCLLLLETVRCLGCNTAAGTGHLIISLATDAEAPCVRLRHSVDQALLLVATDFVSLSGADHQE